MKYLFLLIIRFYQYFISPWLGRNCRFHPTCSSYAKEAITTHGALKGLYLSLKRILKCNPFFAGGFDPVPTIKKNDD
jgi:putative membrane protein insertion efficiency factor